jgi:hypothetical protein
MLARSLSTRKHQAANRNRERDPCKIAGGPVRNCEGTRAELPPLSCYNSSSLCLLSGIIEIWETYMSWTIGIWIGSGFHP